MSTSNSRSVKYRLAYFISPHGYGHAARAAAIMAAIQELEPAVRFEIFTRVPGRFFQDSLKGAFGYHPLLTDIGLVQKNTFTEDLAETLQGLDHFLPFDPAHIERLAQQIGRLKCDSVLCDIAPMGIAVATAARVPSILVENFTWDWIYQGYLAAEPRLQRHVAYLQELFEAADYLIQAEPICRRRPADLVVATPISRKARTPARQTRQRLGLPGGTKAVLITTGGIPTQYTFLEQLESRNQAYFVIPGASNRLETRQNLVLLPHHSTFFHPDLITTADVVIGKVGYSTIAEVYQAGVPFGYIPRQQFPESKLLVAYIEQQLSGLAISEEQFQAGDWLARLPELLALPRLKRPNSNGAEQAARFILDILG